MNKHHFLILLLISLLFGFYGWIEQAAAATGGQAIWAELLKNYVKPGGVYYVGFKSEEEKLDQYLKVLEHTDLRTLSREEQFAYYINAYNALTIKLILNAYPDIKSIKDLGTFWKSPWKKKFVRMNVELLSCHQKGLKW